MKTLYYLLLSILFLSSCDKFDWHNPFDPECPKELFTPSSPGATMEGNSIRLTWTQENDYISGFALFRSAEGESITNLTQTQKNTTQYLDANFTPGKKYTYYVVAVAGTNKSDTVKAEIIPIIPVSVSTGAVTEVTATSAKVSGNITNAGGGTVTSRGICWSTTPNPTVSNSKTTEGTGIGQFTSILTNILAGTTYYARAYGENSRGISYGSEVSFTTLGPPKLTTTAVTNITATSATSGGTITSDGGSPITAKGVVWSTSPNPTISITSKTDDGSGLGNFTSNLANLSNNTRYYIRSYATNSIGTSYGEEFSFTTLSLVEEKLKQGLVAFFPFSGNANDSSGNGRNGIVSGASLIPDRFNNINSAYYFNGIPGTKIQTTYSGILGNNSRSISVWVKRTEKLFNANMVLTWGKATTNSLPVLGSCYAIVMSGTDGRSLVGIDNGGSAVGNYFINAADSKWHNYIFVYDQLLGTNVSNVKIYIDGALVGNDFTYNTVDINTVEGLKLVIGEYWGGVSDGTFLGSIDDVRIYNRPLTQEEITYLANN